MPGQNYRKPKPIAVAGAKRSHTGNVVEAARHAPKETLECGLSPNEPSSWVR